MGLIVMLIAGCTPVDPDLGWGDPDTVTGLERRQREPATALGVRLEPNVMRWVFGPDERRIAAWNGRDVHVVALDDPAQAVVVGGWSADVDNVLLSRDGQWVGAVLDGGVVEVRSADTWELRGSFSTELAHNHAVISSNGDFVALTHWGNETALHGTEVWQVRDGTRLFASSVGYSQLVFMPGDYRLVGATAYAETVSVLNVGSGEELWRYVVGSSDCALESPVEISPRGTHIAYSLCGHVVYTQEVGKKRGPAIAYADGCGEKHVYAQDFAPDGRSVVVGDAYWQSHVDVKTGAPRARVESAGATYPTLRGDHVFATVDGRATQITHATNQAMVVNIDDLGEPTSDGRFFIGTDAIYDAATGEATPLPYVLLLRDPY